MVLYLGMRIAAAGLIFSATFAGPEDRVQLMRQQTIALAHRVMSQQEFFGGLQALARGESFVLELGRVEQDQVAFYLWDPA